MGDMLFLLVGILGFVAVAGVGFVFVGGDSSTSKATKRAQAVVSGTSKLDKNRPRSAAETAGMRRKQILQNLKDTDRRQRKATLALDARIRQAGLSFSLKQFWIYSAVLGVTLAGIAVFLHAPVLAGLGLGFAAGLGLPRWILGFLCKHRVKRFTESVPDAIDIITRGIKSGLPVHECLKVIARESPQPIAGEFQRMVENMSVGLSIDQGLEKMYERMPTAEVRFLTIVMAIQQKSGGNLAEALGNLSAVLRARKLMKEKVKAMSGEAVASAFIIGSLPPGIMLLVQLSSPAYMHPLFTDPRGHIMLLGGALWMATGIFVMRRMINFKM